MNTTEISRNMTATTINNSGYLQHRQYMNEHTMSGKGYSMHTVQQTVRSATDTIGQKMGHLLRSAALGLTLILGLAGFSLPALASVTVKMTSPTANTTVAAPGTFTLTATATSSNSTIKNVAFYQGTTLLATVTTSPYTYTWSNVAAGTYSLTAKATDNLNATKTSTAVSVKSVTDTGPVVTLTSPAANSVVAAPASFTLTATATSSASTIASVAFYQGTTLLSTVTKSPYTYTWSGVAAGTYSITAKATDKLGKATTSTAVSVISDGAPTVSLTSPAANSKVAAPGTFTLTASAASTTSTIKSVAFYNGATLLSTVTTAPYTYTWSNVAAGTYSLTAKATDNSNVTATSTAVSVTSVTDTGPTVSLTSPAANTVSTAPGSFTLTASAASSTSTIAKVDFYQGTTLLGTVTSSPYTYNWTNVAAGNYSLTAVATDALGKATTSTAVAVVSDALPTVSLTSPLPNAVSAAPGSFTLTATAASTTSTIKNVAFYNGTTLLSTVTSAPYTFTWNSVAAGTYSLTAKATDNNNVTTTSSAVSVTSDALPTVSLTSPAPNAVATAPGSFTLTASAASTTSTIAKVDFYNGTTLLGTATSAPYTYTWSNVAAGTYSLTAKATDVLGQVATSTAVSVTSDAAPSVSLTAPANNSSYTLPANITLTANASSTGTISKVAFYNGTTLLGIVTAAPYTYTWNTVPVGVYSITAVATDALGTSTTSTAAAVNVIAAPTVTLTSPANNTVSTAPGSFTLTANASSAGSITSVAFYNGTTLLSTVTAAPYTYTWSNVPSGTYSLTAVVTDSNNVTTTSSAVSVISNTAPTVSLTSPLANAVSVAPGSFTLTANASDADGTIASVAFYQGTTLLNTVTAAPYTYNWTNVAGGTYSLTAVATDNLGAKTTSTAVTVTADALATVSLTSPAPNAVSAAPGSFTLTATATSTTSTISKVDFYASLAGTNTLVGTATTAPYSFSWSNVAAGTYSLTAVATDALGNTSTSAAVSVISDQGPVVTLTSPTAGAQITSPNSFTLTANATSAASTISKVDFYNGSILLGTATTAPYSYTWSNVPVGSYSLTAVATDALGTATTSAATTVSAIADQLPTVSIATPGNGAAVAAPGSFNLTANATSTTSSIAKVDYYSGTTLIGTATTAPYSFTWSSVPLGTYSITAVATDVLNTTTTSAAITLVVNTGVAQAYYIYTDHLDTARLITDTSGNVVWQWDNSDPFGNNPPNENPSGQGTFQFPLRYSGMFSDPETNTFYNTYRDCYDPSTGRYCQGDPIGLGGGSWSTYTYVNGNPLSYVDPLGLGIEEEEMRPENSPGRSIANDYYKSLLNQIRELQPEYRPPESISNSDEVSAAEIAALRNDLANLRNPPNQCTSETARLGGFKSEAKWSSQLEQRGWTSDLITEAIQKGDSFPATNLVNKGNDATRYVSPTTGQSVVVDTVTNEVIHVGGPGFKY